MADNDYMATVEFLERLAAQAKELARQAQLIEADIERFRLMQREAPKGQSLHSALGDHVPVFGPDPRNT